MDESIAKGNPKGFSGISNCNKLVILQSIEHLAGIKDNLCSLHPRLAELPRAENKAHLAGNLLIQNGIDIPWIIRKHLAPVCMSSGAPVHTVLVKFGFQTLIPCFVIKKDHRIKNVFYPFDIISGF